MDQDYQNLIQHLIDLGYLKTQRIIEAFQHIDRKLFVPDQYQEEAYHNEPISIGHGQTISQPLTVAFMMELLEPKIGERVLDIGAGSGWQTALLADIVDDKGSSPLPRVVGIERLHELAEMAKKNIDVYELIDSGVVEIIEADGTKGYEQYDPYDKIVAAAAGEKIPEAWEQQLKIGGKIVAPVGDSIVMLEKTSKDNFIKKEYHGFSFVPLVSE